MQVQTFTVGRLSTNCYVVHSQKTREAVVIDPGFDYRSETEQICQYIDAAKLKTRFIVNTHGHPDHVSGDQELRRRYSAPICIHKLDSDMINETKESEVNQNIMLKEGSLIAFGDIDLKVIHTSGHTEGSICLLAEKIIFTGDTLFAGSIGRTDFSGGSYRNMMRSLEKLRRLPDDLVVYPGHGPSTTIGEEKRGNPFLQ